MRCGRGGPSWPTGLLVLAVVGLAAALYSYRSSYDRLRRSAEQARPTLVRTRTVDGLVGARLPSVSVVDLDGRQRALPGESSDGVVWLVRVDECPGCLEQRLRRWNALVMGTDLDGLLVLAGVGPREAQRIAREAGIRSDVAADSSARTFAAYGLEPPSISFVTDDAGQVLLADARFYGTTSRCGWRFFDQVRALYGGGAADRIRATGNPSS